MSSQPPRPAQDGARRVGRAPARAARTRAQEATPVASPVPGELTDEEGGWLERASRNDVNGWIHLKIEGAPFERGFQHGYLVAAEYADAIRVYEAMTYQTMGFDYSFFVEKAAELHKPKITPELTEEMEGIAAGLTAGRRARPRSTTSSAGTPTWR